MTAGGQDILECKILGQQLESLIFVSLFRFYQITGTCLNFAFHHLVQGFVYEVNLIHLLKKVFQSKKFKLLTFFSFFIQDTLCISTKSLSSSGAIF